MYLDVSHTFIFFLEVGIEPILSMNIEQKQQLFEQQFKTLYQFAYRYVALRILSSIDREDVVAQAYTDAYARLNQYDEHKGVLQQWLTGILRYKVIDYWRQKKMTVPLDDMAERLLAPRDVTHDAVTLDQKLLFKKIMEQLPDHIRILFTLRYVDDLTYQQIADLTGKKATTIRKLFSDTHKQLRGKFSDEFLGEE